MRRQIGPFCADFRPLPSRISVSARVELFGGDFWRPVSASKNSVPGDRVFSAKFDRTAPVIRMFCAAVIRDLSFWAVPQLFRIEAERLKLPAPFSRRIAKPLDADAAGQATFYGCFHKIGREEGKRDGHIDLANAALLASAKLGDRGHAT